MKLIHHLPSNSTFLSAGFAALLVAAPVFADDPLVLPDPDGKPADMSKPVQVYILMGQSNMVGAGKINGDQEGSLTSAVKQQGMYPYLIDDQGAWTTRKDVRNVFVMENKGKMQLKMNDWLTVSGKTIGPEFGIGHQLGNAIDAPVLLLKSCIGNRSLGWDLLPPGSERFTVDGATYAGYKDAPTAETLPRPGWKDPGKPVDWYAGKQYDDDVANAKKVLAELATYYPEATKFEVAGFFFWQGEKDGLNDVHAARYEQNLVAFIKALRKDFDAPNTKFVLATMGEAAKGSGDKVMEGQLAVDGKEGKYPEFKDNVATVYSNPLSLGSSGNAHYGGDARTYMNVGEAMGAAMVSLLGKK
jgi:Carbohydrate esterase, sialic acid-specific acetylesterase